MSSGLTFGSTFTTFFSSFISSLRCAWLSLSFFFTVLNMASISILAFSSASFCAFFCFCCRAALWEPGAFIEFCMCAIFCCTTLDLPLFFRPNVASFIFCSFFFFFSAFAWSFWVAFAAFPFFPITSLGFFRNSANQQPNKKNLSIQKTDQSATAASLSKALLLSLCLWRTLVFRYGRSRVWRRPFFVIPSRIPTDWPRSRDVARGCFPYSSSPSPRRRPASSVPRATPASSMTCMKLTFPYGNVGFRMK